jgi:phage RecT family recombinase
MTTEIQQAPRHELFVSIEKRQQAIVDACSDSVQFTSLFTSLQKASTANPKILRCSPASVMDCMLCCAKLGIDPNGEHNGAWLIPYGNTLKVMIGYNGYIDLITRSSDWFSVSAENVYHGEHFEAHAGTRNEIIHQIDIDKRDNPSMVIASYAMARGPGGACQWIVCDKADLQKSYNASKKKDMWNGFNRPEMTKKTAVRKLAKYMVLDRIGREATAVYDDVHGYAQRQPVSGENEDLRKELGDLLGGKPAEDGFADEVSELMERGER